MDYAENNLKQFHPALSWHKGALLRKGGAAEWAKNAMHA